MILEIVYGLVRRVVVHGQHNPDGVGGELAVAQLAHLVEVSPHITNPVVAGEPRVNNAFLDVARNLLRAKENGHDLGVVHHRLVRAGRRPKLKARALKKRERSLLQAAFGESKSQSHELNVPGLRRGYGTAKDTR